MTPDPCRSPTDFERLRPALEGCAGGTLPANVALLRLAMEAGAPEEVERALLGALVGASGFGGGRRGEALGLWRANPQAFGYVKAVIGGVEHGGAAEEPGQGVADWAQAFDRLAQVSPEGGVALYALGNPDLLRAATLEVVERMRGWGLLGREARVVEVGCGIGRFVEALAGEVAHVTGLDVSEGMIARARERCGALPNVTLGVSSGRDLSGLGDGTADLVLGADVFPYLVQAGVAERHVAEAARVLRPGGHLLILNYSYRGDAPQDGAEVADLADQYGFDVLRAGTRDLTLWDAAAFLLRKA